MFHENIFCPVRLKEIKFKLQALIKKLAHTRSKSCHYALYRIISCTWTEACAENKVWRICDAGAFVCAQSRRNERGIFTLLSIDDLNFSLIK